MFANYLLSLLFGFVFFFVQLLSPLFYIYFFPSQADYFSCVATVVYIRKESSLYQACPSPDCNKKVIDQQNGLYRCEKCNREFPNFKYRLLLSVSSAHSEH